MRYDVIIVGGRIAGCATALHLARGGLRVLLLERGGHPSPHPASSPVIYAPALALLDALELDERDYAHNTPPIRQWVIEADGHFRVTQPIPNTHGRDYGYAVDRARFDAALWRAASAHPNVDARDGAAVVGLLREGDTVRGVRVRISGEVETHTASLVVGADGRFSLVAREVGAATLHARNDHPTTLYYAYWRGVAPLDGGAASHLFSTGGDYGLLVMDSADDTAAVVIEGRADIITPNGDSVTAFYEAFLRRHPRFYARLADAQRVTAVAGMKRVSNGYRTAGGTGWALVGDALHQKDPLDGQGIYDALFTADALGVAVLAYLRDGREWSAALADYEAAVYAETWPMYLATLQRVQREIYTRYPSWFMAGPARWLYTDPAYRAHWARLFVRDTPPEGWFSYPRVGLATLRGLWHTAR